jgi:hypothetical protein
MQMRLNEASAVERASEVASAAKQEQGLPRVGWPKWRRLHGG